MYVFFQYERNGYIAAISNQLKRHLRNIAKTETGETNTQSFAQAPRSLKSILSNCVYPIYI